MTGRLGHLAKIAIAISALSCSILVGVDLLGWIPGKSDELARARIQIAEGLVTQATVATALQDMTRLRTVFEISTHRNEEIQSIALRERGGRILAATRGHRDYWRGASRGESTQTHVRLPIYNDGAVWADLEVRFQSPRASTILTSLWDRPSTRLIVMMLVFGTIGNLFLLRRVFRHLDPAQVVPARVRTALDAMSDGVVLVDPNERIVLANSTFCDGHGESEHALLGLRASSLAWTSSEGKLDPASQPWNRSLAQAETVKDVRLELECRDSEGGNLIFQVAASPILDPWQRAKGAIVTFKDVTELERSRNALETALGDLEKSQDEIRLQNEELKVLAQTDPLTGLSNRRNFMEWLDIQFELARDSGAGLCCVMVDIDHFKLVNDEHGHTMGDDVICQVSNLLASRTRNTDIVCRYGGEEFCIVVRDRDCAGAVSFAERMCQEVAAVGFAAIPISASFGVSALEFGAQTPAELIDQADQALYASKENGRNRVTRFDAIES